MPETAGDMTVEGMIRFNGRARKLYVKRNKVLAVGTFGAGYLEPGDGYIIVCGTKILLSAEQIVKLSASENPAKPIVVTLCGSTRFFETFREVGLSETLAGRIVLSIGAAVKPDDEHFADMPEEERQNLKESLDELHKRKIDLSDEVLILNVNDYVGPSTMGELEYARSLDLHVRWLNPSRHAKKGETVG